MNDAVVMAKVDHFGFDNYAGDSGGADAAIKSSRYPTRNFWITVVTNIGEILSHLTQGPTATLVWDAYDSVYNHAILAGRGTTPPNERVMAQHCSRTNEQHWRVCAAPRVLRDRPIVQVRWIRSETHPRDLIELVASCCGIPRPIAGPIRIVGRNTSSGSRTIAGTLSGVSGFSHLKHTKPRSFRRACSDWLT